MEVCAVLLNQIMFFFLYNILGVTEGVAGEDYFIGKVLTVLEPLNYTVLLRAYVHRVMYFGAQWVKIVKFLCVSGLYTDNTSCPKQVCQQFSG